MKMKIFKQIVNYAIIFAVLFTNGCAFGTREVSLDYPPKGEIESGIAYVSGTPAVKNKKVIIFKFENNRPFVESSFFDRETEKDIIGHVRNGYGMKTANVVSSVNVEEWVTNAIVYEFKKNGYTVLNDDSKLLELSENYIGIHGTTITVYADSFFNYEGNTKFNVVVKNMKDKTIIFQKTYEGKEESINMLSSSDGYKQIL